MLPQLPTSPSCHRSNQRVTVTEISSLAAYAVHQSVCSFRARLFRMQRMGGSIDHAVHCACWSCFSPDLHKTTGTVRDSKTAELKASSSAAGLAQLQAAGRGTPSMFAFKPSSGKRNRHRPFSTAQAGRRTSLWLATGGNRAELASRLYSQVSHSCQPGSPALDLPSQSAFLGQSSSQWGKLINEQFCVQEDRWSEAQNEQLEDVFLTLQSIARQTEVQIPLLCL